MNTLLCIFGPGNKGESGEFVHPRKENDLNRNQYYHLRIFDFVLISPSQLFCPLVTSQKFSYCFI